MDRIARHLMITGRVQGVWFRAWTCQSAEELGLSGWVRNRSDGSVEAVIAGPHQAVETMIQRCHDGPPQASVEMVAAEPAAEPDTRGFEQWPTA